MSSIRIFEPLGFAEGVPARPAKVASLPAVEDLGALSLAQNHACSLEELQAVVVGRIVRSGYLNSAGRVLVAHQDADGRRGRRSDHDYVVPGRGDASLDRSCEHRG